MAKPKKQRFELLENEGIDECLERMKNEGYFPVKRTEKPIFKEVKNGGQTEYIPVGRQIIFEGKLMDWKPNDLTLNVINVRFSVDI